ncbi:tetratricopeptide repeat protein [Pseudomonas sp. EL_65y_Pfl2_R95]|uniref:tetratricopeptide repeat protein n=1 Tax=Pseudomonas sp. EL_65y_Pfl2_R95 TaxID=3088698 RepID=UPI0030D934AA
MMKTNLLARSTLPALLCTLLVLGGCASNDTDTDTTEPTTAPATTQEQSANPEFDQLRKAAESGDVESQFKLGSAYFVGRPIKDLKQAESWWKKAADKGHSMAAVSLAYLYTGRDDASFANRDAMLKYLNQSAAGGNPMAQHILGNLYFTGEHGVARDPNQAVALYTAACKANYQVSCEALKKLQTP